ncbi:hypothetical protein [Antrihabitans sp. YC2-6]|uniref:hypothetical protein n=1 Tax=Antrihabitans sp. YC2-6 TaxID=2799498 RepID=UPI0018F74C2A|nr:hypothetical protein [Antrihabitans sp. YC2-6]MBJ8345080.1 hypothetical protein [Antrihabitans sp. YC2-6]
MRNTVADKLARARVEYCGEQHVVDADSVFHIGRHADLDIDDNRYLHRRCLALHFDSGMWWLTNTGQRLPATVSAEDSGFQAVLVPGTRIPLVFGVTTVVVSAGPTTYELSIHTDDVHSPTPRPDSRFGETTIGTPILTSSQLAVIVALAEPLLIRDGVTASAIPSSAVAAARLGWPMTKFNRKLDNVCEKFAALGVRGLHGTPGKLASNRRARLVEFAVSSRLVTKADLRVLDEENGMNGAAALTSNHEIAVVA